MYVYKYVYLCLCMCVCVCVGVGVGVGEGVGVGGWVYVCENGHLGMYSYNGDCFNSGFIMY